MNYLTTLIASVALLFNTGIHSDAESTFESTDTYSSYYHGMVPMQTAMVGMPHVVTGGVLKSLLMQTIMIPC